MCIAKCLYPYKDDSPENLGVTAVQESKKSSSSWHVSLKKVFASAPCHREGNIRVRDLRLSRYHMMIMILNE